MYARGGRGLAGRHALRARQQPSPPVTFTRGDRVEFGKRGGQLTGGGPVRPRSGANLAQSDQGDQPARGQTLDNGRVEAAVTKVVTHDQVDRRSIRQAVVEVDNVEAASRANPTALSQISRLGDCHRGNVEPQDIQTPAGQPDRPEPLSTPQIESPARGGNQLQVSL